ncbi:MAG: hypothetical protein QXR34_06930 [Saccharolobus sp.]
MVKIKIDKSWYDILKKISEDRKITISELVNNIVNSNDVCLNLPYIPPSDYKELNVSIKNYYSSSHIENKIRYFLFCR